MYKGLWLGLFYDYDDAVDGRRMWRNERRRRLRVASLEDERWQRYQPLRKKGKKRDDDNNLIGRQVIRWPAQWPVLFLLCAWGSRWMLSTWVRVCYYCNATATAGEARKVGVLILSLSLLVKMVKEIYGCVSTRHKEFAERFDASVRERPDALWKKKKIIFLFFFFWMNAGMK